MSKDAESSSGNLAILGGGNLGHALAAGWIGAGLFEPEQIHVTRRSARGLADLEARGCQVGTDNGAAVRGARTVVLAVQPQQTQALIADVRSALDPTRHRIISVISAVTIDQLAEMLGDVSVPIVRAMPNTAVAIGESMTCLSASEGAGEALAEATTLFDAVGRTLRIRDKMMVPATALCACGVAFFLRSIRAASQGGIEIGFHPEEAFLLAAQTAKGASALLLDGTSHPEAEIDRVTTPRGCTIAGLNEMEHQGFSSALIKGILLSAGKAGELFHEDA